MYESFDDPTAEAEVDTTDRPAEAAAVEPEMSAARKALRELEAAKARVERDAQQAADDLRGKLIADLLPVLDNIDRTIEAAEQNGEAPSIVEGVRLVRSQLAGALERYGVERIDARHQRFDPRIHDAISVVPVSHPSAHEVVVDQIAPGYRFGDRLLRPARVVVGRYTPRYH
jgi:molecular chaperone GrpE (heat shock protein)